MAPIRDDDDDDERDVLKPPGTDSGLANSPPLLTRTMVAKRAVPGLASATQTFTDLDHKRISEQALRGVDILDRPSLLWELAPASAQAQAQERLPSVSLPSMEGEAATTSTTPISSAPSR